MILRIRTILDVEDDVLRDIEMDEKFLLKDLHNLIIKIYGFEGKEMASFFKTNENWEQGDEMSLIDMGIGKDYSNETLNTIEAIKIALKERNLNYIISVENSDKNLISINNFLIKLIFTGIYADEVEIKKRDFKIDKSNPHFVLLVQLDDDYDYVFIRGLLTNEQFQKLIPRELNFKDSFNTKIESFTGGINRFFNFID